MTHPVSLSRSAMPHLLRLTALCSALVLSACGGGGGGGGNSDATNTQPEPSPPPAAPNGRLSVLAGSLGGPGNLDGAGAAARFNRPFGLAVGPTGDLYVADSNNQRIRKVTPAGVVSTVAGSGQTGFADGPALQASFCIPGDVAVGPDASVFVTQRNTVRKIDTAGNVKTVAGAALGGCDDDNYVFGIAPKAPSAVAVDAFGISYIADSFAGAVYTLTPAGALTLLAGSDDAQTNSNVRSFTGIALDAAHNVYALGAYSRDYSRDYSTRPIVRITPTGEVTTVVPASLTLGAPGDMARDAAGNLYVADGSRHVVRKITPTGDISIIAGMDNNAYQMDDVDGPLGTGRLSSPTGIAVAADGTVYVSDFRSHTIRRIDPVTGNLSTLAGRTPQGSPFGPHATDRAGNVFVVVYKSPYPNTIAIERVAPDGTITTLVPTGLNAPSGMAVHSVGNVYVVDASKKYASSVVRKITPQGGVSVFAGNDEITTQAPDADGAGSAANLNDVGALTIDAAGNLYVMQRLGNPLRKITPQGVVSTIPVTLPGIDQYLNAVAADVAGNVYLVSCAKRTHNIPGPPNAAILKVDPGGDVTEFAGSLTEAGYVDGPGAQARFGSIRGLSAWLSVTGGTCPGGLTLDAAGNLYVADTGNDTVRKITPGGLVSTAVGQKGVRGIAPGPLPASLQQPAGVSFDGAGNLYVVSGFAVLKVQLPE